MSTIVLLPPVDPLYCCRYVNRCITSTRRPIILLSIWQPLYYFHPSTHYIVVDMSTIVLFPLVDQLYCSRLSVPFYYYRQSTYYIVVVCLFRSITSTSRPIILFWPRLSILLLPRVYHYIVLTPSVHSIPQVYHYIVDTVCPFYYLHKSTIILFWHRLSILLLPWFYHYIVATWLPILLHPSGD